MKKLTSSLLSALLLSASSTFAASISFNNIASDFSTYMPIVDSSGAAISVNSGNVSIGYFTGNDATISGGDFSSFSSFASGNMNGGGYNYDGMFSLTGSGSIATGSSFIGENIYSFITVGSEYLVVKSSTTFEIDNPVFGPEITIGTSVPGNTLLWGSVATAGGDIGGGAVDAYQLVAVPEPSAYAALAGLLALGCVLLRRRA